MKKFSSKIIAGLMASSIGLSPIMSTQVSAMWQPVTPVQNEINIEDYTNEQLLEMLPIEWVCFNSARDTLNTAYYNSKYNDNVFKTLQQISEEIEIAAGEDVVSALNDYLVNSSYMDISTFSGSVDNCLFNSSLNRNTLIKTALSPGGVAYEIIIANGMNQNREYLLNLIRTLRNLVIICNLTLQG